VTLKGHPLPSPPPLMCVIVLQDLVELMNLDFVNFQKERVCLTMDPPEIISSNKLLNFLPFWDVTNKQFLFFFNFFSNFSKISCTYLH